ncbi:ImmA/IrrE family metallo-endopeptidase [Caldovatus aquaticus]|uniref:ImmA/IrrE family metallo-endopeptidase n=1 Tax=Caldovatus aquaticus TaxID=2865671 RepID=A0ABS7F5B7_9PROT|nr:ImmA/IrrE family metallo-endopeptidase [Caldovatus aquaticus]MBW8269991.1 ImmA/IrrE family metallo-endopeptidase [Caldovatus aquaticus]
MPLVVQYPHHLASGAPRPLSAAALWAVAAQVRRQAMAGRPGFALPADALVAAARSVMVNGRAVAVAWDLEHAVHDEAGAPVLGVCETDPELPDTALVSVNAPMVAGRPDLAASTAAHELGHVLFDVPAALGAPARRYRAVTADPEALLDRATAASERRANEFMGALLAPPVPLHLRLLVHARAEGLRTVHAAHHGRQGSRALAAGNPPDAVAGVIAAVAGDFGVSERFIAVRLARYRLLQGGLLP